MTQQLLLADDSIAIQEVVEASLAKQGFKITSVISDISVIQEARQIDLDIILVNSILLDWMKMDTKSVRRSKKTQN